MSEFRIYFSAKIRCTFQSIPRFLYKVWDRKKTQRHVSDKYKETNPFAYFHENIRMCSLFNAM